MTPVTSIKSPEKSPAHNNRVLMLSVLCAVINMAAVTAAHGSDPIITASSSVSISASNAPSISADQQIFHGIFNDHPFWLRLQAPDKQFGKNRVCQLVYTQPDEKTLGGTSITDCPFILIDTTARIVAWNGRDKGSKIVPAAPTGYSITKESLHGEGLDREIHLADLTIPGDRAWDLHLAPVQLALTWKSGSTGTIRVIDFFGSRHAEKLTATWTDTNVAIAGTNYTITADKNGQLATLTTADGKAVLEIKSRQ
jgi:hypothetical protein